ncbi:MAG: hypothetical protein WD044_04240 [Dongiaceae bacterium]
MTWGEIAISMGVFVTLVLGAANLLQIIAVNSKNQFINAITKERINWIQSVRGNVSRFVGLSHNWFYSHRNNKERAPEILEEIDCLRWLIKLQMNPGAEIDRHIMMCIDRIPDLATAPNEDDFKAATDDLVSRTQELLKMEWDRVKREVALGRD